MGELLRTWWPVLLLVYIPPLATTLMRIAITHAFRRLDESHADDLPQTAGEWLAAEIARLGLGGRVRTMVTDEKAKLSLDAYHPFQGVIQLSSDTHFKRDPMHWAIAAHELGHARFKLGWPVLGRLMIVALYLKHATIATALAMVVGNIAFALPHVTDVAFLLLAIGAVLHLFVLLDEIVASVYAMQSLQRSPVFAWSHLRSARLMLVLAFSTYLVGFLARTLLLTQWHLVEQLTSAPIVPPTTQLTGLGIALAVVTSIILVTHGLTRVVTVSIRVSERFAAFAELVAMFFRPALVVFVLLVYNARSDETYAYLVMAALLYAQGVFLLVLMLPMAFVDTFVLGRFTRRLVIDPTHRTSEFLRDHTRGARQRVQGNSALADLLANAQTAPHAVHRVAQLLHLSHIPLVVAFWLS